MGEQSVGRTGAQNTVGAMGGADRTVSSEEGTPPEHMRMGNPRALCVLLSIDVPIIQGGMAWVSTAPLVAAVSNAGGLGLIGSGSMPPDVLRKEIRRTKALTDRAFGVNVMLLNPQVRELLDVALEEDVPVISLGAGDPSSTIKYLKEQKPTIRVICVVASTAHARRAERYGADAVVAEGTEAGGHIGELTTMVLVPQVVDAVKIPVIAAGGIADGRGFVAALALGASGVQIGTRFLASVECEAHPSYKEAIVRARDRDTVVTGRSIGLACRVIKNDFTQEYLEREKEVMTLEGEEFQRKRLELEEFAVGRLRRAAQEGDMKQGSVMSGQSAGLVNDILPVREIIDRIMNEARQIARGLPDF